MDNEIKYRIDSTQAIFLISAGLMADITGALLNLFGIGLFINRVISPFIWLFFLTWFYFLGIKFTKGNGKNLGTSLVSIVIEMIPIIDFFPSWTGSNYLLIKASRREDKGKKPNKKKKKEEEGDKKNKDKNKKVTGETEADKKPTVGGEVKTPAGTPKSAEAEKELETAQTAGAKTAEQKTTETNLNPEQKESKKETAEKEGAEKNEESKKENQGDDLYDTRTNWYKKQQGQTNPPEEGALEELPLQKEETYPSEVEGGQDNEEFSMGDPYREPTE